MTAEVPNNPMTLAENFIQFPEKLTVHSHMNTVPRTTTTDMIIIPVDLLAFVLLTVALWRKLLPYQQAAYRAGWGVVCVGCLWQALVSFSRVTQWRLPDWLWSGWTLQDFGIAMVATCFWIYRPKSRGQMQLKVTPDVPFEP